LLGDRATIICGELSGPCARPASYGSKEFRSTRGRRAAGHQPNLKKPAEYGISGAKSQAAGTDFHADL
jgi:hypothetical protein